MDILLTGGTGFIGSSLLSEQFGDALMLDQQGTGAKARSLGRQPADPPVSGLRSGSYAG